MSQFSLPAVLFLSYTSVASPPQTFTCSWNPHFPPSTSRRSDSPSHWFNKYSLSIDVSWARLCIDGEIKSKAFPFTEFINRRNRSDKHTLCCAVSGVWMTGARDLSKSWESGNLQGHSRQREEDLQSFGEAGSIIRLEVHRDSFQLKKECVQTSHGFYLCVFHTAYKRKYKTFKTR